jgi:hypothetical protein
MEVFAMIYELRVYQPVPGQMPKLLARFRDKLLPIWERHGIRPIGFWTTLVGESSNELTYILPWESLADRETRWTAFQNDPASHNVRDDSERDGPIVASISNQILTPTPQGPISSAASLNYEKELPNFLPVRGNAKAWLEFEFDEIIRRCSNAQKGPHGVRRYFRP